jgi:hypothetical protein
MFNSVDVNMVMSASAFDVISAAELVPQALAPALSLIWVLALLPPYYNHPRLSFLMLSSRL